MVLPFLDWHFFKPMTILRYNWVRQFDQASAFFLHMTVPVPISYRQMAFFCSVGGNVPSEDIPFENILAQFRERVHSFPLPLAQLIGSL